MVVVDFVAQQQFHRFDDPPAADDGAVDVALAQLVLDADLDRSSLAVGPQCGARGQLRIGPRDVAQQVDLFAVEQPFGDEEAVIVEGGDLFVARLEVIHQWLPDASTLSQAWRNNKFRSEKPASETRLHLGDWPRFHRQRSSGGGCPPSSRSGHRAAVASLP